jgi:arylsulfatase A-like enzyme
MTPASAIRRDSWKLIHFYEQDRIELFDLRRDIGEQHDWASSHPDLAASLKRDLDAWRAEVGANAPRLHQ